MDEFQPRMQKIAEISLIYGFLDTFGEFASNTFTEISSALKT
ncbi:hypothetical protein ACEVHA_028385 [Klebsiella pneumoniae]